MSAAQAQAADAAACPGSQQQPEGNVYTHSCKRKESVCRHTALNQHVVRYKESRWYDCCRGSGRMQFGAAVSQKGHGITGIDP